MNDAFTLRVRQVVMDVLGDPLSLPTGFRSWLPRWVQPQIELPRSQVVGAYTTGATVAALGERVHGRPCTVRAGASPYEFLQMTYDETYGKWVSSQTWFVVQTGASSSIPGDAYAPAGASWFARLWLPNCKALYDAGLRPQVFTAALLTPGAGGTQYMRAAVYEASDGSASTSVIGTGGEISRAGSAAYKMSGWQDITFSGAPTQTHAQMVAQARYVTAAGSMSDGSVAVRWVSD